MAGRTRPILVIDGDIMVRVALEPYFKANGLEGRFMKSAAEGLADALVNSPSLILVAAVLPDGNGVDLMQQLRKRARTSHIPIMFMGEHDDSRQQNEVLRAGADDYITKPIDPDIAGLRIRNAVTRAEREGINHPRTGLPTGRLIQERMRALADEFGWYKIDFTIDNFDSFVDRYGFMTGEEVLAFTGKLINEVVQVAGTAEDFIGHRDDTFFVIITNQAKGQGLRALLEKRFNQEVLSFYSFIEREQGYIQVDDGAGGFAQKALMSARIKVQEGEPG